MNFALTEEQRMVREAVRDFAAEVVAPRAAEIDQTINQEITLPSCALVSRFWRW